TMVMRARCKLRYVVDGRIGFDAAQFSEVVDGVTAVACTASDAEQKQSAATGAQGSECACKLLDGLDVDGRADFLDFVQEFVGVCCHHFVFLPCVLIRPRPAVHAKAFWATSDRRDEWRRPTPE